MQWLHYVCLPLSRTLGSPDRKIIEISKIVSLSAEQEAEIRKAYDAYNATVDSALYEVEDPVVASRMKYAANKRFSVMLMRTLTEKQRSRYIRITSIPDVEAKAEYKVSLLRESGDYTESELEAKKTEIFNYLMAEKLSMCVISTICASRKTISDG